MNSDWDVTKKRSQLFQFDLLFINQRLKNIVDNATFRPQDQPFTMNQWVNGELL
jgi:hypothetical protein